MKTASNRYVSRTMILLLAVGIVVSSAVRTEAHDDGDGHGSHSNRYGDAGQIDRGDLPTGTAELVADAAIELANHPSLAEARSAWDLEADFVDQVDYQLRYRAGIDYLSSDPDHLGHLLLDKPQNMGSQSLGLFLTDEEAAEMVRRARVSDVMDEIVRELTGVVREEGIDLPLEVEEIRLEEYGGNFGGIWQDQGGGGAIVLALVEPSSVDQVALAGMVESAGGELVIIQQELSLVETEVLRGELRERLNTEGIVADVIVDWSRSDGRRIEVRSLDGGAVWQVIDDLGARGLVRGLVETEVAVSGGAPATTHSFADQMPGLRITTKTATSAKTCTWGFNGHTTAYNYILTAGHCMPAGYTNYSGWVGSTVEMYQNNSTTRNLTPGDTYIVALDTTTYDAARVSSTYADDNCYHGNNGITSPPPHCGWPMANRSMHSSWEEGADQTCASLANSNTYRCGFIEEIDHVGGNRVRARINAIGGDSGSGMKWDYRIDGILTDISTLDLFFQQAYHVISGISVQFNCHSPGKKTNANPANWANCPQVNA